MCAFESASVDKLRAEADCSKAAGGRSAEVSISTERVRRQGRRTLLKQARRERAADVARNAVELFLAIEGTIPVAVLLVSIGHCRWRRVPRGSSVAVPLPTPPPAAMRGGAAPTAASTRPGPWGSRATPRPAGRPGRRRTARRGLRPPSSINTNDDQIREIRVLAGQSTARTMQRGDAAETIRRAMQRRQGDAQAAFRGHQGGTRGGGGAVFPRRRPRPPAFLVHVGEKSRAGGGGGGVLVHAGGRGVSLTAEVRPEAVSSPRNQFSCRSKFRNLIYMSVRTHRVFIQRRGSGGVPGTRP